MKIPDSLLADFRGFKDRLQTVQTLRERLHRAKDDAGEYFKTAYLANPIFEANDEVHKRRVLRKVEGDIAHRRQIALGVARDRVERPLARFAEQVAVVRDASMEPPDPIDAWMALTGGERRLVSDQDQMLQDIAHEQRLTRWMLETPAWQPSRWLAAYEDAKIQLGAIETARRAASFLQFAEARFGAGWTGPKPADAAEEAAAIELRKAIVTTRHARIPDDVLVMEASIDEARKVLGRVRDLERIDPINPASNSDAAAIFDAELADERARVEAVA